MNRGKRTLYLGALVGALALAVTGCVHQPDAALTKASGEWKSELDAFLASTGQKAGTPAGAYDANKPFYEKLGKAIEGEVTRISGTAGSEEAVEILKTIATNVELLRGLHEAAGADGLAQVVADPAKQILESQFRSLEQLKSGPPKAASTPN